MTMKPPIPIPTEHAVNEMLRKAHSFTESELAEFNRLCDQQVEAEARGDTVTAKLYEEQAIQLAAKHSKLRSPGDAQRS